MAVIYKNPPEIFTSRLGKTVVRGPMRLLRAAPGTPEHWQLALSTGLRICRTLMRDKAKLEHMRGRFRLTRRAMAEEDLFGSNFARAAEKFERQHTLRFIDGIVNMLLVGYMDVVGTKQVRQSDWVPLRKLLQRSLGVGNVAEHRDPDYYFFNAVRARIHRMRRKYSPMPFKEGRRYIEQVARELTRQNRRAK